MSEDESGFDKPSEAKDSASASNIARRCSIMRQGAFLRILDYTTEHSTHLKMLTHLFGKGTKPDTRESH